MLKALISHTPVYFSRWGLVLLLSLWAIWVQITYRVPSQYLSVIIPWIGLVLTILEIIFLANLFLARSRNQDQASRVLHRASQWGYYALFIFIGYSIMVYVNGQGPKGNSIERKSEILAISDVRDDFLRYVPYAWIELRSWKNSEQTIRIFWEPGVDDQLYPGQPVLVQIREGLLGIPWVAGVISDEEAHALRVLSISPTASGAWKELVWFYINHQQWNKALKTAQRYLSLFPQDMAAANGFAVEFNVARRWWDTIALVEPYIHSPGGYLLANHYGWILGQNRTQKDRERAITVLQAAMAREPHRWQAPYHLGFVLSWNGQPKEALKAFEHLQKLRPGSPDVLREMAKLKKQLHAQSESKSQSQ